MDLTCSSDRGFLFIGMADLWSHELAHFLLARNEAGLLRPLRKRVRNYFRRAIDDAKRRVAKARGWRA